MELEERILFEDNHLIVVSKKAGELVQGDHTGDVTLADFVKEYLKKNTIKQVLFTSVLYTAWTGLQVEWLFLLEPQKH